MFASTIKEEPHLIGPRSHSGVEGEARTRGLLNDLSAALRQQLFFWGCDVKSEDGNLLAAYGFERLKCDTKGSSSCYRMGYGDDIIELNSLCVGLYSETEPGFLFTRQHKRCWAYLSPCPPTPGTYAKSDVRSEPLETVQNAGLRFLWWWLDYEEWILANAIPGHRMRCHRLYDKQPDSKAWLKPEPGLRWLRAYLKSPATAPRARNLKFSKSSEFPSASGQS